MIKYSLRILALVLLFIIIIVQDIPYPKLFKSPAVQLYLAIMVMLLLLMLDNVTGFILGVCLLVLYFKIYNKELKIKKSKAEEKDKPTEAVCPMDRPCKIKADNAVLENYESTTTAKQPTQIPYVSEEILLAAQNNIVNTECYNNEILGIQKGLYNENVYGPQGLDKQNTHIRGYDVQNSLLGTMHYDIL